MIKIVLKILTIVLCFSMPTIAQEGTNGMLILGSDHMETLQQRMEVGYKLYQSSIDFDYIIVSGGCAAHSSNICEASEMAAILVAKGVPAEKIYKEEKSKTTVQNYCYSRALTKADGSRVINPGDNLYVVSNHWHAMPVAARFSKFDSVKAVYHIEGQIVPAEKDKVNYSGIYNVEVDSDDYCRGALWPLVKSSFCYKNATGDLSTIHLLGDVAYNSQNKKNLRMSEAFPELPEAWTGGIDAAFFKKDENKVYLFKGDEYLKFAPGNKVDPVFTGRIQELVQLPGHWEGGHIDAAIYYNKVVTLFKGDEYVSFFYKKEKVKDLHSGAVKNFAKNWPFEWSDGYIDAAHYCERSGKLVLFRGKEYLDVAVAGENKTVSGKPKNLSLAWPEDILGEKRR